MQDDVAGARLDIPADPRGALLRRPQDDDAPLLHVLQGEVAPVRPFPHEGTGFERLPPRAGDRGEEGDGRGDGPGIPAGRLGPPADVGELLGVHVRGEALVVLGGGAPAVPHPGDQLPDDRPAAPEPKGGPPHGLGPEGRLRQPVVLPLEIHPAVLSEQPADDLHSLLELLRAHREGFVEGEAEALELGPVPARTQGEEKPSPRDAVHRRSLLGDQDVVAEGHGAHERPHPHPPGHGGEGGQRGPALQDVGLTLDHPGAVDALGLHVQVVHHMNAGESRLLGQLHDPHPLLPSGVRPLAVGL